MLGGIIGELTGANRGSRLKGTVVLMRKNVLDLNDFGATVIDGISEVLGRGVTCQLISSTLVDPNNGNRGKVGAEANLEQWLTSSLPSLTTGESKFGVTFDWEVEKLGVPGAICWEYAQETTGFDPLVLMGHKCCEAHYQGKGCFIY